MKKTVISLLLAMTLILSMSVSVFAGDYKDLLVIVRDAAEQVVSEWGRSLLSGLIPI